MVIQSSTSRERIDRASRRSPTRPIPCNLAFEREGAGLGYPAGRTLDPNRFFHDFKVGPLRRSAAGEVFEEEGEISGSMARSTPTRSRIDVTFFAARRAASESATSRIHWRPELVHSGVLRRPERLDPVKKGGHPRAGGRGDLEDLDRGVGARAARGRGPRRTPRTAGGPSS